MFRTATTTLAKRSALNFVKAHTPPRDIKMLDDLTTISYCPWDPCSTRILPSSCGDTSPPPVPKSSVEAFNTLQVTSYSPWDPCATRPVSPRGTTNTNSKAFSTKRASIASTSSKRRPWPYNLPKFLQPWAGTMYDAIYGPTSATKALTLVESHKSKPCSIIQALLYGIPDPDEYKYGREIVGGKLIRNVLYGVEHQSQ